MSLQVSLSDADLNATVVYFGLLVTDEATLRQVEGPVPVIFGAEDSSTQWRRSASSRRRSPIWARTLGVLKAHLKA